MAEKTYIFHWGCYIFKELADIVKLKMFVWYAFPIDEYLRASIIHTFTITRWHLADAFVCLFGYAKKNKQYWTVLNTSKIHRRQILVWVDSIGKMTSGIWFYSCKIDGLLQISNIFMRKWCNSNWSFWFCLLKYDNQCICQNVHSGLKAWISISLPTYCNLLM